MSSRSDAEKENERKEKRFSMDSPSTLLSPASKMHPKKVRLSMPFGIKSNDLAVGDAKLTEQSSTIPSSPTPPNAMKVLLADELKVIDEGGRVTSPIPIVEEPKVPTNTPVPSIGPSSPDVALMNESMKGSFVALVEDPFLDASASETMILDSTFNECDAFPSASFNGEQNEHTPTKDESFRSDSTFVGEVLATDVPGVTLNQSPGNVLHLSEAKISAADGNEELQRGKKEEDVKSNGKTIKDQVSNATTPSRTFSPPQIEQIPFDGDNMERNGTEKNRSFTSEDVGVELITTALSPGSQLVEALDPAMAQMDSGAVDGTNVGEFTSIVEQTNGTDTVIETNSHTADDQSVQYESGQDERREEVIVGEAVPLKEAEEKTPIKSIMKSESMKKAEESSEVDVSVDESGAHLGRMGVASRSGDDRGGSAVRMSEAADFEESSDAISNESIAAACHFAESTPQFARLLSTKKRMIRESLVEPPSTPDALLNYAKQRIDDYSFRINEAYCDSSQLCVNCYALRIELENITKKLSLVSEEHGKCQMVRDVGESSLECVGQLKSELISINEQLVRLTSENATLKQHIVDMEVDQRAATELQELHNEQRAELEQLRRANEKLVAEKANLTKDIDDYRFVMDGEVAKWKNSTNELKKKVYDLEGQLEARMNVEEAFEAAKVRLKAQFDHELAVRRQQFEEETVDARSLVDRNMKLEADSLKEELLALRDQLAEERSKAEAAETKLATASREREELLNKVSAVEKSNLAVEECECLRRKVETLEGKLEQQTSLGDDKFASLQKERDELLAKVTQLEKDLQGELETKEIIQDALKGSEELKNDLAEQLVTMEEASSHQVKQLSKKISELEKELSAHSQGAGMDMQVVVDGNAALLVKLQQCEAELEKKESSLKTLRSEIDQLAEEKKSFMESSERKERLIEELRHEYDQLLHQMAQQGSAASEYLKMEMSQKASVQKEISSLREQLSNVVEQTTAIVSDAVRVEFERGSKEKADKVARLENAKRQLEQQVEKMGTKGREAELEQERKELKLEQLKTELAALRRAADESKADFERLLQAKNSEWENRVAHWRDLSESKEGLVKELAESMKTMKSEIAQLVKANVEEKMEWLQKRAAQSDVELKSLNEKLAETYRRIEREQHLTKEKDEHLLALKTEIHDLRSVVESVKAEKEAAECKTKQVTMELTKMVDAQEVREKLVKMFWAAECVAARRISELDGRSRELEEALTEARKNEERMAIELKAQTDEAHALKEQLNSVNEKMKSERSKELGEIEILQAELNKSKREVVELKAKSQRAAVLEKELATLKTEREADFAKMKIELMESLAKYDSANSALDKAARRIEDLELKLSKAQESAPAVSVRKQDQEELEELRLRVAMLQSENDRMGAACDEADEEIMTLREETLELKRKLAFKDGLSEIEVARRLGNMRPFRPIVTVAQETVVSIDDTSVVDGATPEADGATPDKTENESGPSKSKAKSPGKKSKSYKKDEPAAEQQSCRTQ